MQPVSLPRKEVSSTPGPDSMGEGLGGVLYSARRGLRTKEARENWEEREERKGKKTTFSPLFVSDNNELFERK